MKKLKRLIYPILIFSFVVFYSCEKNTVEIENHPEELGPYQSLADFYNQNGVETQIFTIDPQQPSTITGSGGLKIIIPGNSLYDDAGQQPAGMVTVTLKEVYSLKNMMLSHITTTSNGSILEWDGMFYIDFYSGSVHYKALFTWVTMPTSTVLPNMYIFRGTEDSDIGVNWIAAQDTVANYVIGDSTGIGSPVYFLTIDSLGGWVNCARLYSGTVTNISVVTQVDSWRGETVDIALYTLIPIKNICINVDNFFGPQTTDITNLPNGMNAYAAAIGVGRISKKSYFGLVNFTVTTGQLVTVTLTQADEEIITALQNL